jgi:hypothetical protein
MKRLAISTVTSIALALALGGEVAAAGATIDTFPVSFTVTSGQCQYLPAGTTLTGSGTEKSITTVRTDANGITTIENSTHAKGTATDNQGNTYVFNYSNSFRISNSAARPNIFSGTMTDSFTVAGNGPAQLHNGFVATLTTDPSTFATVTWHVQSSRGDPISFATGPVVPHCDPL